MRVNLAGLYWTQAKLAGGQFVKYFYAWKGGPRIKANYGTQAFIREFNEKIASRKVPPKGLVFSLIAEFKTASEFTKLGNKTKKDYLRYIKLIEEEFGDMPISALEQPPGRGGTKSPGRGQTKLVSDTLGHLRRPANDERADPVPWDRGFEHCPNKALLSIPRSISACRYRPDPLGVKQQYTPARSPPIKL